MVAQPALILTAELPQEWRSLVPSDFGFHNSLRRNDGSLVFVDFEYFGWDDPVKLTADILLHPGGTLLPSATGSDSARRRRGFTAMIRHLRAGCRPICRCSGLRWVLILLNEFIPERWRRRVLAGDTGSWSEAKARQLPARRNFWRRYLKSCGGLRSWRQPRRRRHPTWRRAPLDERSKYLRRLVVRTLHGGERGHVGSSMSLVEIMRVLYDDILRFRSGRAEMAGPRPHDPEQGPRLHRAIRDARRQRLHSLRNAGHLLPPRFDPRRPSGGRESSRRRGFDRCARSRAVATASAWRSRRASKNATPASFVVMGDGEINEGSVWEAALCAGKHKLVEPHRVSSITTRSSRPDRRAKSRISSRCSTSGALSISPRSMSTVTMSRRCARRFAGCRSPPTGRTPSSATPSRARASHSPRTIANWHHKSKIAKDVVTRLYAALE